MSHPSQYCAPQMSDNESAYTSLRSSWIFCLVTAALSLIPVSVFRYGSLALVVGSVGIHAALRIRPSVRIGELDEKITGVTDLLSRARSPSARNFFELDDIRRDLLQATMSASKIRSDLLEARDEPWKTYFQKTRAVWQKLDDCERRVRKIRKSTLIAIESEKRRRLAQEIKESEDTSAALSSAGIARCFGRTHDSENIQEA